MAEWVIDTNVLLVATRAVLGRPPRKLARRGEDVPVKSIAELQAVYMWLQRVRESPDEIVVIDFIHRLVEGEYANKLDKEDYGRKVIAEKLSRGQCRLVEIEIDENGHGMILHDAGREVFDLEDRKMVAAALESQAPIANACDTDWYDLEKGGTLGRLGVSVTQLIHDWCHGEWQRKKAKLTSP